MKKKIIAIAAAAAVSACLIGCSADTEDSGSKEHSSDAETISDDSSDTASSEEEQSSAAEASVSDSIFEEQEEPEPEPEPEMFDVEPIVKAYHSGDRSGLSELEIQILDRASEIFAEVVTDEMDVYEKELALHDYMIANCTYDSGALRAIPRPSENSDNPYGALINGEAICKGYTTTFSLLMGMADIPCITIHSTDHAGEEHAWNAVQINGAWYYVDSTWDDPVPDFDGRLVNHRFFNVSKSYMMEMHMLGEEDPETESTKDSYVNRQAVEVASLEELPAVIEAAFERGADSAEVIFTDPDGAEGRIVEKGQVYYIADKELKKIIKNIAKSRYMDYYVLLEETERGTVCCFNFIERDMG